MPHPPLAVLGLDQSTSATKAFLLDAQGRLITEATRTHGSHFPHPGWVEQDPDEIVEHVVDVLTQCVLYAQENGFTVKSLGITNQRETVVVWDRRTGKAVANALGWQCLRGQALTEEWRQKGYQNLVLDRTGLPLDPHFSASKIAWVLQTIPGCRADALRGDLAFGTIDSWIMYRLTGGRVHATDPSNASRTLLFGLESGGWDAELFDAFAIPLSMAPEVRMSDADYGDTDLGGRLQEAIPIRGVLGDSHAALFGLRCFEPGAAKATFGTGSSVMMNLGKALPPSRDGTVATSVAWGIQGALSYVLEGNIHHSGDTLQWLVEDLDLFRDFEEWQRLADSTPDGQGVYLVPAFSGLGAPYWDEKARGAIVGLVRGTTKAQVARAGLESLAFQVADLLDAMRQVSIIEYH